MRTELKTAFRPFLEPSEPRILAAVGLSAAMVHHPAPVVAHHPTQITAESHHKAHAPKHSGHSSNPQAAASPSSPSTPTPTPLPTPVPTPTPTLPTNTTPNQAWVEFVNMTGRDLEYQVKLGPYADGQFLAFDIGPGASEYRMSSLISSGQRVKADFAIQFGNGPVTPLLTGISQQSAQGYYIFMDSNFEYYVSPFIRS